MFETRIKELHKIAAMVGMRHVTELFRVLSADLDAREKAAATEEGKKEMSRLKTLNEKLSNIVIEWSKLETLISERSEIKTQGGKGASHYVAEKDRQIQHVRNKTSYNKKILVSLETTDNDKRLMGEFVEILKLMIKN